MCGLLGAFNPNRPIFAGEIDRARRGVDLQSHRGPDGLTEFRAAHIVMLHNRLEISSLGETSRQPFRLGELTCCFNGEIYNYGSLCTSKDDGPIARQEGMAVLRTWKRLGWRAPNELDGEFAIAIYDGASNVLHLARDRSGVKPLHYAFGEDGTVFYASEVRSLIGCLQVRPEVDLAALRRLLVLNEWNPSHRGYFANIGVVMPGACVTFDGRRDESRWYSQGAIVDHMRPDQTKEDLQRALEEAVHSRMQQSEWPVYVSLSGGVDSSAIAAIAHSMPNRGGVRALSISYASGETGSDLHAVELFQRRYPGTQADVVNLDVNCGDSEWSDLTDRLAEPVCDSVPFVLDAFYSDVHKRGIKVVVSGEGADDYWFGYPSECSQVGYSHFLKAYADLSRRTSSWRVGEWRNGLFTSSSVLERECITETMDWLNANAERLLESVNGIEVSGLTLAVWGPLRRNLHQLDILASRYGIEARVPYCAKRLVDAALRMAEKPEPWRFNKGWIRDAPALSLVPEIAGRAKSSFAEIRLQLEQTRRELDIAIEEIVECRAFEGILSIEKDQLVDFLTASPRAFFTLRGIAKFYSRYA